MANNIIAGLKEKISNIGLVRQIKEINARYATPQIKMTPTVRFVLLFLRLYLLFLVVLLGYRFFMMVR